MFDLINTVELVSVGLKESTFSLNSNGNGHTAGIIEINIKTSLIEPDEVDKKRFNQVLSCDLILKGTITDEDYDGDRTLFSLSCLYHGGFYIADLKRFNKVKQEDRTNYCLSLFYAIIRDDQTRTLHRAGLRQIELPWKIPVDENEDETPTKELKE
jgi:hypothetical protein